MTKKIIGGIFIFSLVFQACRAQYTQDLTKALFLIDIAEHTKFATPPIAAYTITVIGQSKVYNELISHMQRRQVNGVPFTFLQVDNIDMLKPSHIIFFSSDKSDQIKTLASQTPQHSFMIVGEQKGTYKSGADFSFVIENDKLKVDINRGSLQTKNIILSKTLNEILHESISVSNHK